MNRSVIEKVDSDFSAKTRSECEPKPLADPQLYVQEPNETAQRRSAAGCVQSALADCRLLTAEGEQHLFKRLNFVSFRADAIEKTLHPSRPSKKKLAELKRLRAEETSIRDEIAVANLRLVASIAARVARSGGDFDEFFSEGNSILIKCIEKFDYSRGFRFSTYVTTAIQRHLYRLISKNAKLRSVESVRDDEILRQVPGVESNEALQTVEFNAAQAIISRMDEALDDRENFIVRGRLGLDGSGSGKTFQRLGDDLGLSKERIRQLFNRGIEKLGDLASGMGLDSLAHE
jgi:RNA polymerase sigma factor (sigma-70 family)